jgi:hypothetical protein
MTDQEKVMSFAAKVMVKLGVEFRLGRTASVFVDQMFASFRFVARRSSRLRWRHFQIGRRVVRQLFEPTGSARAQRRAHRSVGHFGLLFGEFILSTSCGNSCCKLVRFYAFRIRQCCWTFGRKLSSWVETIRGVTSWTQLYNLKVEKKIIGRFIFCDKNVSEL